MKPLLICFLLLAVSCLVSSSPQMMGMGMGNGMGQEQQSQMSEMGAGMGLNIGLGVSGGNYGRTSQMGGRGMKVRRLVKREKNGGPGCYGRRRPQPPLTTVTTSATTTATEAIDPRES